MKEQKYDYYKGSNYIRQFCCTNMCNHELDVWINSKDKQHKHYENVVVIRYSWCWFLNTFPDQQLTLYCLFIHYCLIKNWSSFRPKGIMKIKMKDNISWLQDQITHVFVLYIQQHLSFPRATTSRVLR